MLRNAASLSYCILCILGIGLSEVGAPPEGRGLSENMCGIFGLYSHGVSRSQREVFGLLINGLKRLEYRGYDSAGVSVDVNASGCAASRPIVVKTVGTVDGLSSVLDKLQHGGQIQGKAFGEKAVGIGHTRWATHGMPSCENCHPHEDSEGCFCVVHNGIITNHAVLREYLVNEGYKFSSDTDTEVVPHLCHKIVSTIPGPLSLLEVVRCVASQLEGAFSLIITSRLYPGELVACKRGSPLLFGTQSMDSHANELLPDYVELDSPISFRGAFDFILSSDACGILEHTQKVVYLHDEDILHLAGNCLTITSLADLPVDINRSVQTLSIKLEAITKGSYKYFMEKEIFEQADSLRQTMKGRIPDGIQHFGMVKLGGMLDHIPVLERCSRILLIACGSSYHACLSCRDILEMLTGKPVHCEVASDMVDRCCTLHRADMCVFVSQSGETADTLQALKIAKQSGAFCVGITNVVCSTVARKTHCGIHVNAGCEIGVASTKAYTGQIVVLIMMGMILTGQDIKQLAICRTLGESLCLLPHDVEQALSLGEQMAELALTLYNKQSILIIGRGPNYATALEGALKIKEVALVHSEGVMAGELKHGPLALIDKDLPVIMIATADTSLAKMHTVIDQLRCRDAKLIIICHKTDQFIQQLRGPNCHLIEVPQTDASLQPVLNVIPLQLLSCHIAVMRGLNVDQPRNLAKSVTVADT